jgi:hypothetical protein
MVFLDMDKTALVTWADNNTLLDDSCVSFTLPLDVINLLPFFGTNERKSQLETTDLDMYVS